VTLTSLTGALAVSMVSDYGVEVRRSFRVRIWRVGVKDGVVDAVNSEGSWEIR